MTFVNRDTMHAGVEWLCFGTGCGQFLVYHGSRKSVGEYVAQPCLLAEVAQSEFTQYLRQEIFGPGDSVESFACDPSAQRFAITSHYGHLRVCHIENARLTKLWEDKFDEVIPRAVTFGDQGASVIVYVMETGTM